jgi:hypothetical protein
MGEVYKGCPPRSPPSLLVLHFLQGAGELTGSAGAPEDLRTAAIHLHCTMQVWLGFGNFVVRRVNFCLLPFRSFEIDTSFR